MIIISSDQEVEQLKLYISYITIFLKKYKWLIDSFVLDFFTENHWSKLPESWQLFFNEVKAEDIGIWLSGRNACYNKVWPLSLQAFRFVAKMLSLPRKSIKSMDVLDTFLKKYLSETGDKERDSTSCNDAFGENEFTNLDHIFIRHVKPKKQYEIKRFAQVAHVVLCNMNCHHVLDIGSGQGHLSRLLSLNYGLKVITMEAIKSHIVSAEKYDNKALTEIIKRRNKNPELEKYSSDNLLLPKHIVFCMSESENDDIKLLQAVKNTWKEDEITSNFHFSIIGLHTCGNLAADMLKLFSKTYEASAILSIGCCYMKMDLNRSYPLSNHVKQIPESALSYEALEIGCHAIETYIDRLKNNSSSLKIHCYRAALETLIIKYYPDKRHIGLHSVRHGHTMPFAIYVQNALKKVNLTLPLESVTSQHITNCLQKWNHVVIFYSLRLLIAPVIETLILLDRMLFLHEKDVPCILVPIFDPALSPRNHMLIGIKPSR